MPKKPRAKRFLPFSLLLTLLLVGIGSVDVSAEIAWNKTFSAGLEAAKKANKPMLVDMYTSWCGWCKVLDRETFSNQEVQKYLAANVVPVKVNAEVETTIAQKYGVRSYPTILILTSDGIEMSRISGFQKPDPFMASVKNALVSHKGLQNNEERQKAGKMTPDEELEFGRELLNKGNADRGKEIIEKVIQAQGDKSPIACKGHFLLGQVQLQSKKLEEAKTHFAAVVDHCPNAEIYPAAFLYLGQANHMAGDAAGAIKWYLAFVDKFPDRREATWAQQQIKSLEEKL